MSADSKKKTQEDESVSESCTLEQAESLICDGDKGESIKRCAAINLTPRIVQDEIINTPHQRKAHKVLDTFAFAAGILSISLYLFVLLYQGQ